MISGYVKVSHIDCYCFINCCKLQFTIFGILIFLFKGRIVIKTLHVDKKYFEYFEKGTKFSNLTCEKKSI